MLGGWGGGGHGAGREGSCRLINILGARATSQRREPIRLTHAASHARAATRVARLIGIVLAAERTKVGRQFLLLSAGRLFVAFSQI